jgi:alpha/beta superfamily hydrolase
VTGPANGMYPRLARELAQAGIASLRLDYRRPGDLETSVIDGVIGVGFLREEGVGPVALVGHSAGGAVVITVGAILEEIVTVVALATQSYGTDFAEDLEPASLLLVHGLDDPILSASCSVDVDRRARTRSELRLIEGAGHSFEGHEDEVNALVLDWLRGEFAAASLSTVAAR